VVVAERFSSVLRFIAFWMRGGEGGVIDEGRPGGGKSECWWFSTQILVG